MIKKNIKDFLTLIVSVLITLTSLEIIIRIYTIYDPLIYEIEMGKYAQKLKIIDKYDDEIFLIHKANQKNISIMGTIINTDERGFRKNRINVNENLPKIILLGDSMTFGFGSKITFADYIQEKFYKSYKINNAGVGNTNTVMQVNQFFSKYENLEKKNNIKYIILNFYINDLELIELNNFKLSKYFFLFNLIEYKIKTLHNKDRDYVNYYKKTFLNQNFKKYTLKKILLLNTYSLDNEIKFVVNFIPDLRSPQNYKFHDEENEIKLFLSNNNIPYIENLEKFLIKEPSDYWVTAKDPHPNELSHFLLSLNLISYIQKNEVLK